jgi:hypothetical protein
MESLAVQGFEAGGVIGTPLMLPKHLLLLLIGKGARTTEVKRRPPPRGKRQEYCLILNR